MIAKKQGKPVPADPMAKRNAKVRRRYFVVKVLCFGLGMIFYLVLIFQVKKSAKKAVKK